MSTTLSRTLDKGGVGRFPPALRSRRGWGSGRSTFSRPSRHAPTTPQTLRAKRLHKQCLARLLCSHKAQQSQRARLAAWRSETSYSACTADKRHRMTESLVSGGRVSAPVPAEGKDGRKNLGSVPAPTSLAPWSVGGPADNGCGKTIISCCQDAPGDRGGDSRRQCAQETGVV